MPILRNPRHEAFAQAYAKGEQCGNAQACYRLVYNRENRQGGYHLLRREEILLRVKEIVAEHVAIDAAAIAQATEDLGISKKWVLTELVENTQAAKKREDGAVVNKALELLGKHLGMFHAPASEALNVNVGLELVDRPPREDYQQWVDRRRQELMPKLTNGQGNGKAH